MKTIVRYQCEVCNYQYRYEEEALQCESRGVIEIPPVGTIYGNPLGDDHHRDDMVFAVSPSTQHYNGHLLYESSWACRDNGYGDSLGDERCGNGFLKLSCWNAVPSEARHTPVFKRMVAWLQSQDIEPHVWTGQNDITQDWDLSNIIPYNEWLEQYVPTWGGVWIVHCDYDEGNISSYRGLYVTSQDGRVRVSFRSGRTPHDNYVQYLEWLKRMELYESMFTWASSMDNFVIDGGSWSRT